MIDAKTEKDTLAAFRESILANEGTSLTDDELFDTAVACLRELQWRVPLTAVRQGDLPEDEYGAMARLRRNLADTVADANIYEGYPGR